MMSKDEVVKIVRGAVAETFAIEEPIINNNLTFKEDLQADSLGMMSLAMVLEDEFGAEIEIDKVSEFITINNVIDYILDRQKLDTP